MRNIYNEDLDCSSNAEQLITEDFLQCFNNNFYQPSCFLSHLLPSRWVFSLVFEKKSIQKVAIAYTRLEKMNKSYIFLAFW